MNDHYRDLQVSFLRFCADFITGLANGTTFVNFDGAPDENQLPNNDVLGPMAMSIAIDEHFIEGSIQIGISTYEDVNNFRLSSGMNELLKSLLPTAKVPVYDSVTGVVQGAMIVQSPVRVMPVINGKARPLQFIAVSFSTTRTYDLRQIGP